VSSEGEEIYEEEEEAAAAASQRRESRAPGSLLREERTSMERQVNPKFPCFASTNVLAYQYKSTNTDANERCRRRREKREPV
jgi:hypothetical protein